MNSEFIVLKYKDLNFISFKPLLEEGFIHGFFLGPPNLQKDKSNNFKENLSKYFDIDKLFLLNQVHGVSLLKQNSVHSSSLKADMTCLEEADGWILMNLSTQQSYDSKQLFEDCFLRELFKHSYIYGIKTADCIPLILYSKKEKIAGLLHAGWKGVKEEILRDFLEEASFAKEYSLLVGPSAGDCCYEVENSFLENNFSKWQDAEDVFKPSKNKSKSYLSLQKIIYYQALELGIAKNNIHFTNICTICNKDCYSFRREKESSGRQLSFALGLEVDNN